MDKKLLSKIRDELEEDLGRWCPEDEDGVNSWCETCLDFPGGNLKELLDQIPESEYDEYYEKIDDYISEIAEKANEDMDEDEDNEDDED